MRNILKNQKRVIKLRNRTINYNGIRNNNYFIIIEAKDTFRITEEQIKSLKLDLNTPKGLTLGKINKIFHILFLFSPNKILTHKGTLVRMGGGKSKVLTKVFYATPYKPLILLYPKNKDSQISKNIISKILNKLVLKYPFLSYKFPL